MKSDPGGSGPSIFWRKSSKLKAVFRDLFGLRKRKNISKTSTFTIDKLLMYINRNIIITDEEGLTSKSTDARLCGL